MIQICIQTRRLVTMEKTSHNFQFSKSLANSQIGSQVSEWLPILKYGSQFWNCSKKVYWLSFLVCCIWLILPNALLRSKLTPRTGNNTWISPINNMSQPKPNYSRRNLNVKLRCYQHILIKKSVGLYDFVHPINKNIRSSYSQQPLKLCFSF